MLRKPKDDEGRWRDYGAMPAHQKRLHRMAAEAHRKAREAEREGRLRRLLGKRKKEGR